MSRAPVGMVEQAQRLVAGARMLPVDDAVKVLEQAVIVLQAAQARVLVEGERSGELVAVSGCRTVRSFAMSILRRSASDASGLAGVAVQLVALPKLAKAYDAGGCTRRTCAPSSGTCPPAGWACCATTRTRWSTCATRAGPAEVAVFCQALAEVHHPGGGEAKVRAAGSRSVRISAVGDLAHLDAMLDPAVAARLKATLTATAKASRSPDDTRTHGERTADALEQLLQHGMEYTEQPAKPDTRRARATVTVALETLLGLPGHGQALLARFGLTPTTTAQHLSCDALVSLVLTHGDRVLNVGRTRRTIPDPQQILTTQLDLLTPTPTYQRDLPANPYHQHTWGWTGQHPQPPPGHSPPVP
ncbi:MAG TPA: DUF222 domain-containing protein [Nocardioidaceae bacterium]|nr:DUF222 domain-containing protein [Nocardioidaceae bacterium]